jgi:hypothetical protein
LGARFRSALAPLAAFLLPLGVYLLGFRYVGSGDTRPAELLPITLLRDGDLDFREFLDPAQPFPYWYRKVGGRVVSTYPILPGLLNVPVFAVADLAGADLDAKRERLSMISASVISALSVLFLYLCLHRLYPRGASAFLFAMVYAFGTCVWSVTSRGLWQHGPSLLFLTAALWMLVRATPASIAASGLFLGLAVVNRPTNLLLVLPLAAVVWAKHRRTMPAFLGLAAVPLLLRAAYAAKYFGSPFSMAQANPIPAVAHFGGNPWIGLAGLLVSPSRGLFVFGPVFLFVGLAVGRVMRRGREDPLPLALLVGVLSLVLVMSSWTIWWGGNCFGYRLLIETLPALTILLVVAWTERVRGRPALAAVFWACVAWSVLIHGLGAYLQPSGFNEKMGENPAVLWSVRDSEIAMTAKSALARLEAARR